jgi:hypothetical protein
MKTKFLNFFLSFAIITLFSCKKGPGEGGRAAITGKVYSVNYNSNLSVPQDSGYLGAQKVYILYGDDVAVGKSQDSNNEGAFEFNYLRKGKYKVYVYTKTAPNRLDSAVVQEGEITDNKQMLALPDFRIKTNKN